MARVKNKNFLRHLSVIFQQLGIETPSMYFLVIPIISNRCRTSPSHGIANTNHTEDGGLLGCIAV
jgi:hypothetical protein